MAITQYVGDRFVGLSTDVKPTSNLFSGAMFDEMDTMRSYRYSPISGWIWQGMTELTGLFYPNNNPSGFLTASSAGGVNRITVTGIGISGNVTFTGIGNDAVFLSGQTVVISGNTNYYPLGSNPSGYLTSATAGGVQEIIVSGTMLSGNVTFTGIGGVTITTSGQNVLVSGQTGFYPYNQNPSGYITSGQTGQFLTTGQTGQFQANLGYTPLNKAGDTSTGIFNWSGAAYFLTNITGNQVDLIVLGNTFVASSGLRSTSSPSLLFSGQAYIGSGNQTGIWRIYNKPNSGNNAVAANLYFDAQLGTGGYQTYMYMSTNGNSGIQIFAPAYISGDRIVTVSMLGAYVQQSQTGNFITNGQTGGFLDSSDTGQFVTTGMTGGFLDSSDTGNFITNGQTGNFVTNGMTGILANRQELYRVGVQTLVVTGFSVSGNITLTGAGNISITTGSSSLLVVSGNVSNLVTTSQTGNFVTTSQTGNFVTTSQTGNFVTTSQTGNFVTNNQTGNFVTTSQTGDFANLSQVYQIGVLSIAVTGFSVSGNLSLTGAGNISVITGSNSQIIVSGNTGNLVFQSMTGGLVDNSKTGGFAVLSQVYQIGVQSLSVTGFSVSGSVQITGVSGIVVTTGSSNQIIISSTINTGNFVTTSQTGNFVTTSQTGNFVTNNQTGIFVTVNQTGNFITNGQTGNFVTNTQTGNFVTTSQTGGFVDIAHTGFRWANLASSSSSAGGNQQITGGQWYRIAQSTIGALGRASAFVTVGGLGGTVTPRGHVFYVTKDNSLSGSSITMVSSVISTPYSGIRVITNTGIGQSYIDIATLFNVSGFDATSIVLNDDSVGATNQYTAISWTNVTGFATNEVPCSFFDFSKNVMYGVASNTIQTGTFYKVDNVGVWYNGFYAVMSNQTGGFLDISDTGQFVTTGMTGGFLDSSDTGNFITNGQTGNFVTNGMTGILANRQELYRVGVQGITVTGQTVSGTLTLAGLGNITITTGSSTVINVSGNTGVITGWVMQNYYPINNPNGFINTAVLDINITGQNLNGIVSFTGTSGIVVMTGSASQVIISSNINTGNFVTTSQTGNFITNGQTGNFVTNNQTGIFVTVNQTGNFITNGQTGNFITNGQTGNFITNGQTGGFVDIAHTGFRWATLASSSSSTGGNQQITGGQWYRIAQSTAGAAGRASAFVTIGGLGGTITPRGHVFYISKDNSNLGASITMVASAVSTPYSGIRVVNNTGIGQSYIDISTSINVSGFNGTSIVVNDDSIGTSNQYSAIGWTPLSGLGTNEILCSFFDFYNNVMYGVSAGNLQTGTFYKVDGAGIWYNGYYAVLSSQTGGFLDSSSTGQFVTTGMTGQFVTTGMTGAITGWVNQNYYPITNPNGYINSAVTNLVVTGKSLAGNITLNDTDGINIFTGSNTLIYINVDNTVVRTTGSQTVNGGKVFNDATSNLSVDTNARILYNIAQPRLDWSKLLLTGGTWDCQNLTIQGVQVLTSAVTNIQVTGLNLNGTLQLTGVSGIVVTTGNASQIILSSTINTGNFVTTSQTGNFITNGQTGNFITNGQTGNFITNGQTGNFITNGQTGGFLDSSKTGTFVTSNSKVNGQIAFWTGNVLSGDSNFGFFPSNHTVVLAPTNTGTGAGNIIGLTVSMFNTLAAPEPTYASIGAQLYAEKRGTGNLTSSLGLRGVQGQAGNNGSGTVSQMAGGAFFTYNVFGGPVTEADAIYIIAPNNTSGTVTNQYGINIQSQKSTNVVNSYGIYQFGTTDNNVFAGKSSFGTTATSRPSALVHLASGISAASGAPLKFTAGTNLSSPEAGAVEFDGTNLYYTDSGPTRQTLATQGFVTTQGYLTSAVTSLTVTGKSLNGAITLTGAGTVTVITGSSTQIIISGATGAGGGNFVDDGTFVHTTGQQIIFGVKTFSGNLLLTGLIGSRVGNPTAQIHLSGGNANSSSAPIKINAGTIMTTPENGAMEYDGNNLYITMNGTGRWPVDLIRYTVPLGPIGAASTTVDWSTGSCYYFSLGQNLTLTHSNMQDGQTIRVIINQPSNQTWGITWNNTNLIWKNGAGTTPPSVSAGGSSGTDDVYTFTFCGITNKIYGDYATGYKH